MDGKNCRQNCLSQLPQLGRRTSYPGGPGAQGHGLQPGGPKIPGSEFGEQNG